MELDRLLTKPLVEVEPGLFSVIPAADRPAHYDAIAGVYDAVIASWLYNRLVWGNPVPAYRAFAARALEGATGPVLDAGCGSMVFTQRAYAEHPVPVVLLDRSLGMLRRAKRRKPPELPGLLVQGDLYDLPFGEACFERVSLLGILHVLTDRLGVLRELHRVLQPGGTMFAVSIVLSGSAIGDGWARVLHRRGELAEPVDASRLVEELVEVGFEPDLEVQVRSSMAYLVARKPHPRALRAAPADPSSSPGGRPGADGLDTSGKPGDAHA